MAKKSKKKRQTRKPLDAATLSDAQLEIMNAVWDRAEAGVADVWAAVKSSRDVSRNTVQTTLNRLAERGWLKHREVDGRFLYRATQPRERTLRSIVSNVVTAAFSGSTEGLVQALLAGRKLDADEAKRIRQMIDDAEGGRS